MVWVELMAVNDRNGDLRRSATTGVPHMRADAASATVVRAKGGFVRVPGIRGTVPIVRFFGLPSDGVARCLINSELFVVRHFVTKLLEIKILV